MEDQNKQNPQPKCLLVLGSAPCIREDVDNAFHLLAQAGTEAEVMAIGMDAVNYLGPIKYFATYHPGDIDEAAKRRKEAGLNTDYLIISHMQYGDLVKMIIPLIGVPSGSSALLGVHAGIKLGYEKIILCGCPLEGKNTKGGSYESFRAGWTAKYAEVKDQTRSLSGWTRELLGAPTLEWVKEIITTVAETIQNHNEGQLHER